MSNQEMQKTLEVKIRPYSGQNNQERPDLKGVSRVHLSRDALLDLRIDSGQAIYLWKADQSQDQKREAVAWLTAEKSLSKKVVQISKSFQEAAGYKLGDDLLVAAAGNLKVATNVVLRDITESENAAEMKDKDKAHWEWLLEQSLGKCVFYLRQDTSHIMQLWSPLACLLEISTSSIYRRHTLASAKLTSVSTCGSVICWHGLQKHLRQWS